MPLEETFWAERVSDQGIASERVLSDPRTDAWNPGASPQQNDSASVAPVFSSFRAGPILLGKFCVSPKDSLRDRTILFVLAYRRVEPKRIVELRMAER